MNHSEHDTIATERKVKQITVKRREEEPTFFEVWQNRFL